MPRLFASAKWSMGWLEIWLQGDPGAGRGATVWDI
ncbi:hypothetical protein ABIA39_007095 [Nocardia sp. GAS34]